MTPELAFDQGPDELFVVRLAGNFVNNDGLASIEYGARFLGVPLIMVLGHSNCGAMAAAIKVVQENTLLPGHLPDQFLARTGQRSTMLAPMIVVPRPTSATAQLQVEPTEDCRP